MNIRFSKIPDEYILKTYLNRTILVNNQIIKIIENLLLANT